MDLSKLDIKKQKWLIRIAIIFFSLIVIISGSGLAFAKYYEGKIYPGIKINNFNLGGLTAEQAQQVITGEIISVFNDAITIHHNNVEKQIPFVYNNTPWVNYDNKNLAQIALSIGRHAGFFKNIHAIGTALFFQIDLKMEFKIDELALENALRNEFGAFESPANEPKLEVTIHNEQTKTYSLEYSDGQTGTGFNYSKINGKVRNNLINFNNNPIEISLETQQPTLSIEQIKIFENQIKDYLNLDGLILQHEELEQKISWSDFAKMLEIIPNENHEPIISLNRQLLLGQLESLAQSINRPAKNAKISIQNNKVTEFQASLNGRALDFDASYQKIISEVIENKNNVISMIVEETEPEIKTADANTLGIKELIGVGRSNFAGSPANRRHNIGVGSASVNGTLIAPGQEFSLVKTLGTIDAQSGYLPELVIKENKTIPEYGGGLCQVGTTTFRMALDAGVTITERRNHSYRVSYYEPAGTDATIYDPKPDFRFVNDTAHHILIQTKIQGNELIFEMWGTNDGRVVEQTKPVIYNITQPGPTKLIESTDLKPGEKKCTESAHAGADAYFKRTITYANGETKEETWTSHYVPWQAVCLIGVDPSKPAEPQTPPTEQTIPLENETDLEPENSNQ